MAGEKVAKLVKGPPRGMMLWGVWIMCGEAPMPT